MRGKVTVKAGEEDRERERKALPEVAQNGCSVEAQTADFIQPFPGHAPQGIDLVREEAAGTGFLQFLTGKGGSVTFLGDAVEDGTEEEVVAEREMLLQFGYGMARA